MAVPDPKVPSRADFRYIRQILMSSHGGQVEHVPSEYEAISRVFSERGGSWERLFNGSPRDIDLLKDIVRDAVKSGFVTKKRNWK